MKKAMQGLATTTWTTTRTTTWTTIWPAIWTTIALVVALAVALALPGCGGGSGGTTGPEAGVAARVTDLEAVAGSATSVTLAWTVPADVDKAGGLAYDLRYVTLGNEGLARDAWSVAAAPVAMLPAGQRQQHTVTGLAAGVTYAFSLSARYGTGAWSQPSAPAVGTAAAQPDITPPARVLDLVQFSGNATGVTVAWSLAGDDTVHGRAASYDVRYATEPLTAGTWAAATAVTAVPTAHPNPAKLVVAIDGLASGQAYHVGLKAIDDAGLASGISNTIVVQPGTMRTLYVREDGTGDYAKLNDAIQAAVAGDIVLVAPGRYTWTNQGDGDPVQGLFIVLRDQTDFTIRGEGGADVTILDAEGEGRVLYVQGGTFGSGEERTWAGVTIEGFTFTGGVAPGVPGELGPPWAGAGIALHLTDTLVRDCVFRGNTAVEGGAVWMGGQGGSRLENCLVEGNTAQYGGGVYLVNSEPVMGISGCVIRDNSASIAGGGIYLYNVGLEMEATLVLGNAAFDRGGGMYVAQLHDGSWIERCSILANSAPVAGGVRLAYPMTLAFARNLVAHNAGGAGIDAVVSGTGSGAVLEARCTLQYGNGGGNALPFGAVDLGGNFVADPLLCSDGYSPSAASPCLPANRVDIHDCGVIGARDQGCGG